MKQKFKTLFLVLNLHLNFVLNGSHKITFANFETFLKLIVVTIFFFIFINVGRNGN